LIRPNKHNEANDTALSEAGRESDEGRYLRRSDGPNFLKEAFSGPFSLKDDSRIAESVGMSYKIAKLLP